MILRKTTTPPEVSPTLPDDSSADTPPQPGTITPDTPNNGSTSASEEDIIDIDVEVLPLPALGETAELNVHIRDTDETRSAYGGASLANSRAWVEFYYTNPWGSYSEAKRAIQVPLEEVLLSGDLSWEGDANEDRIKLKGEIQLPREGIWKIGGFFSVEGSEGAKSSYTRIIVTQDTAVKMIEGSGPFAYLDNFNYGHLEPGYEIALNDFYPVVLELDISQAPGVGEEAILSCRIISLYDAPDFSCDIRFWSRTDMAWIPGEDLLINGDLGWKGDLKPGEPVEFSASIEFPREEEWRIDATGNCPTNDRLSFSDSVEITITDEGSYFGLEERRTTLKSSDIEDLPFSPENMNVVTELGRPKSVKNIVDIDLQIDPNAPDSMPLVEPGTPPQLVINNSPDAEHAKASA